MLQRRYLIYRPSAGSRPASAGWDPKHHDVQNQERPIGPNNSAKGKPFVYSELRARIGAVLRRRLHPQDGPSRVGDLVIDPLRRRVTVGDREIVLAKKEFALLRVLASDPTRVFTKEQLLDSVWAYRGPSKTRTLDSHASRLRRKLDPEHGRFVVNCWGIGYRLVDG